MRQTEKDDCAVSAAVQCAQRVPCQTDGMNFFSKIHERAPEANACVIHVIFSNYLTFIIIGGSTQSCGKLSSDLPVTITRSRTFARMLTFAHQLVGAHSVSCGNFGKETLVRIHVWVTNIFKHTTNMNDADCNQDLGPPVFSIESDA